MPSHAYFYAAADNPLVGPEDEPGDTPERRAVREKIITALTDEFEDAGNWLHADEGYTFGRAGDLEIDFTHNFMHVRLPWYGMAESERTGIVPNLRRFEAVLREAVGFDAFEHGCQGLHTPGDIDLVPVFLAGMQDRIAEVMGSVPGSW